jgi:SAM-dependent methyltransferase
LPVEHWVERDRRRVRAVVFGPLSIVEIVHAIDASVADPDFEPGFDVLSDHREVRQPITTAQLEAMVGHLGTLSEKLSGARWAVVTGSPASYGMMRMLAVFAERVGITVRAVHSLDEAEQWLASGDGARSGLPDQEQALLERLAEPELMLDAGVARAYAAADFSEPHDRFVRLLRETLSFLEPRGTALDLGCGAGDVTLRFARAFPGWTVDAVDGSPAMLALARKAALRAGLASRVRFLECRLPAPLPAPRRYELLLSNSLLHHLAEPGVLWAALRRWARPGSAVFVMDLLRPASRAEAEALVERHARDEPEVLRGEFLRSLLAAYRPQEVESQLARAGLGHLQLEIVSDRHFVVSGQLGEEAA